MDSLAARKKRQYEKMLAEEKAKENAYTRRRKRESEQTAAPPAVNPEIFEVPSLLDAQAMYMRFVPIAVIARETGLPIMTIRRTVYAENGWKSQRDEIQKEVNESIKQSALVQLQQATGMSLLLIIAGLRSFSKHCEERKKEPTLEETQLVAGIFSRIHKAKIVEEMDPESKKALSLTPGEILRSLAQDPYLRLAITAHGEDTPDDAELETKDEDVSRAHEDTESLAYPNR